MSYNFIAAIALLLVLEGILPFISPKIWRHFVITLSKQNDKTLRITGLVSMVIGVIILIIAKFYFGD